MNVYKVLITGEQDGESYEDEHELLGDSVKEIRERVRPMLGRGETVKSVAFLRKHKD